MFLLDSRKWDRAKPPTGPFPLAVAEDLPAFSEGTLRVRFKLMPAVGP